MTTTDPASTTMAALPQAEVRRLRPDDRRNLIASSARAFTHDPMFGYFTSDRLRSHRLLPGMMRGNIDDLVTHGDNWVADDDEGAAIGIAGWLSPAQLPRGVMRDARIAAASVASAVRLSHRMTGARLLAKIERIHPKEPHWYLALLIVDPDAQGRGLGSALIQPGLDLADRDGLPCYLETQKRSNVSWYQRFGFEVTEVIEVGDAPPMWGMIRPAP